MERALLPAVAVLTCVAAYVVGRAALGLPTSGLARAAGRALECVGLTLVFLVADLLVGAAAVVVARRVSAHFLSIYLLDDIVLPVIALLQALVFQAWLEERDRRRGV